MALVQHIVCNNKTHTIYSATRAKEQTEVCSFLKHSEKQIKKSMNL